MESSTKTKVLCALGGVVLGAALQKAFSVATRSAPEEIESTQEPQLVKEEREEKKQKNPEPVVETRQTPGPSKVYFIGLGLGDEKDITVRGLEAIKTCDYVYLEAYTAILGVDKERLEEAWGVKITIADRTMVEQKTEILGHAKSATVALLVVGDPLAATTHTDLFLRAYEDNIPVEIIHNASIMNAVAACGMQLYNFGQSVSICFWRDDWQPDSFYTKIKQNQEAGFHTLCLLDIKVKEQTPENLAKEIEIYEPSRYMTVNTAIEQLLECEQKLKMGLVAEDMPCIGLARVGQPTQKIVSGTMKELLSIDFGEPLHSVVIPGHQHFIEEQMYGFYHWDKEAFKAQLSEKTNREEEEREARLAAARLERKQAMAARVAEKKKKAEEAKKKQEEEEDEESDEESDEDSEEDSEEESEEEHTTVTESDDEEDHSHSEHEQ